VNDVTITVATANGTGSQSANLVLLRSIANMGIPAGGKNMFPSNIQGLPTWFTVRANHEGWASRRRDPDVMVAMNIESIIDDVASLLPGSTLIVNKTLASHVTRTDIETFVVPFDELVVPLVKEPKLRKMVINMLYVGVLAHLIAIDMVEIERAIAKQFGKKLTAAKLNADAVHVGYEWAREHLPTSKKHTLSPMEATRGKIVIEGNQAAALGLMFGGLTVLGWYPITPSSSLAETCIEFMSKYRHDPETGKATYASIQAEDELASMAIVVGAGWAGARAATATSGPGISLMSELVGLAYFAEIPAVIVDVQRMGPSTGLPTRVSQGDILKAYNLSHGDCRHPLLLPGNVRECFEMAAESLDLAARLQTVVFLMLDLDLGMNLWLSDPFEPPQKPIDRGKVLSDEDLTRLGEFARYKDVDGDGICYRTLPGTKNPLGAYFTRGTGHTERATYTEKPGEWKANLDRLSKKFETTRTLLPRPVIERAQEGKHAEVGIIAFGSSDPAVQEARHLLGRDAKLKSDYLRLRALPVDVEVREFIAAHRVTYVIEQNRDAQCTTILRGEMPEHAPRIVPILYYSGMPMDAQSVFDDVLVSEKRQQEKRS
jgi:2-oxoglutarate ferredoxin oxidoreductase subunit alpha